MLLIAVAALCLGAAQAQDDARARLIHVASDAPPLDIRVNGELAVADLAPQDASPYFSLPAAAELSATIAGTATELTRGSFTLAPGASAIILLPGGQLAHIADDLSPLEFGLARLFIVNALDGGASFDVASPDDARIAGESLLPGASLGPFVLPAGRFSFSALPAAADGNAQPVSFGARLASGTSSMLIVRGDADDPQLLHTTAAVAGGGQSGRVRFVHAVQGAAAVDLKIDERMTAPSLSFAEPSAPIAIPGGSRQMTLSLGPAVISSMNLDVRAGAMQTVVIMGTPSWLRPVAFDDALRDLDDASALVRLINAVPDSVVGRLRLDSGVAIAEDVGFGEASEALQVAPGAHALTMRLEIGEDRGVVSAPPTQFHAGAYYTLIALAGSAFTPPRLLIVETSLMRRVKAMLPAPAAKVDEAEAAPADETPAPPEPTEAADPPETAPEPESGAPTETTEALKPETELDAAAFATNDLDAGVAASPALIAVSPYATVDLDPSGRLQLRQYPSSDALSLGLISGGTTVVVLGRRGPTALLSGDNPSLPLDLSDYAADPAADLLPAQDLAPAETWLFVVYQTADGGALVGWVNAFYTKVYDETGAKQRLASLPLVRQNRAGSAYNTAMQPPELADSVSLRVHQLSAGARLNLRMANDPTSEVLAHLAPATALSLLGLDEAEAWVYVDYAGEPDKIIRGWVSADYAQLLLNGQPVRVETLRALDETVAPQISDGARGGIRQRQDSDSPTVPPPEDPLSAIMGEVALDPGAMLHLRREPDAHAQSLALIPAGTLLPIQGVTSNADWLLASYDDQDGWVFARYVTLRLRGRRYSREYVESLLPAHDNRGNPRA